jgi:anti-anti-sigma factor
VDERTLTLTFESDSTPRTLLVSGQVDEVSAPAFRDALDEHSEGFSRDLVVDVSDVDFLPSLGVAVLAVALRTARERGSVVELVATKGTIAEHVLEICGLPHRHPS